MLLLFSGLLFHDRWFDQLHGLHGGPSVDNTWRHRCSSVYDLLRWELLCRECGCVFKLCLRHLPGFLGFHELFKLYGRSIQWISGVFGLFKLPLWSIRVIDWGFSLFKLHTRQIFNVDGFVHLL